MSLYDNYSREELIQIIDNLKADNQRLSSETVAEGHPGNNDFGLFKKKYGFQILDSLPDMLTVLSHSGILVDLVSSEETNHVGVPGPELIGHDIKNLLSPEAYNSVMSTIQRVISTNQCSIGHHDITLGDNTRHYENRIFPLDGNYVLCMCRDVTDEQFSKAELQQTNRRMSLAEDIASLSHWYYYENTREFEAPKIIPMILGKQDKGTGRCRKDVFLSHVHPGDREKLLEQLRHPESSTDYVEYRLSIQGKTRYYHSRIINSYKEGEDWVVEGYAQDMTYIVERLYELEAMKYALNNAVEEIFACNMDGSLEFGNSHFIARNNLTDELASYKIYDLESPKGMLRQWQDKVEKIRENGGSYKYIAQYKGENGKVLSMEIVMYIVYDHSKEKEIIWSFSRDITLRLSHENKVKELNQVMDAILNNIPVYLFVKDPGNEFRYLYWNKAFETFSGIPTSVALGKTDYEIFPSLKDAEKFRNDDLFLLKSEERIEMEEEYVATNGETRIVTTSKALVPVEKRLPLIIGVSWDITEMKQGQKALIAAREKAEESDRLKSAFLANMSHEIRTPLNAIVGFSQLIASAETEEEKQQFSDIINSNANLLLQLINDILDLSKIEAGTLEFNYKKMDLTELCREEYEIHKTRVKDGVTLIFDEKYDSTWLHCDHNRLAQVVTNLINNAIKFTDKGVIRYGYDIENGKIEFYVADTGVGIPEQKRAKIFDRFIKLNSFAAGAGLGLSITKMIIEKIGGEINVESKEGEGTTFRFTIPYQHEEIAEETKELQQQDKGEHSAKPDSQPDRKKKILIAEDIDGNFMLLKAFIGKQFDVTHARNGQEALDLFKQIQPDLILMDIKMPVMDGYEATKLIREVSTDVPIIAVTAFAFESDKEKALEAGCNDYLTKPISRPLLNEKLEFYLAGK